MTKGPSATFGVSKNVVGVDGCIEYEKRVVKPWRKKGQETAPEPVERARPKTTKVPADEGHCLHAGYRGDSAATLLS